MERDACACPGARHQYFRGPPLVFHIKLFLFYKGYWYMLLEEVCQHYRRIVPVPVWFRYLIGLRELNSALGRHFGIFLALLYLILKVSTGRAVSEPVHASSKCHPGLLGFLCMSIFLPPLGAFFRSPCSAEGWCWMALRSLGRSPRSLFGECSSALCCSWMFRWRLWPGMLCICFGLLANSDLPGKEGPYRHFSHPCYI